MAPRELERFDVSNEYAQVEVRKLDTGKGERLEITAPKLGYSIRLDALALESISWQDEEIISEFLEEPYGPGESE